MNDFTNRNKFSNPNDQVFIWYGAVRISEAVLYIYIYVVCTELIEETRRPLGMIFGIESWKNFLHI